MEYADRSRDLALFNLAVDSKLRSCDLVRLRVQDVAQGGRADCRASILQQKTSRPVKFELTQQTRESVEAWIAGGQLGAGDLLFPERLHGSAYLSTRQYARIMKSWVACIGLLPGNYGTHSLRRAKATLIYKRTKNLQAVQLPLGHTKLESIVRYLGIEVDDALEMLEQTEV